MIDDEGGGGRGRAAGCPICEGTRVFENDKGDGLDVLECGVGLSGLCALVGTRPTDTAAGTDAASAGVMPDALDEVGLASKAPKRSSKSFCGVWVRDGSEDWSAAESNEEERVCVALPG